MVCCLYAWSVAWGLNFWIFILWNRKTRKKTVPSLFKHGTQLYYVFPKRLEWLLLTNNDPIFQERSKGKRSAFQSLRLSGFYVFFCVVGVAQFVTLRRKQAFLLETCYKGFEVKYTLSVYFGKERDWLLTKIMFGSYGRRVHENDIVAVEQQLCFLFSINDKDNSPVLLFISL